MIILSLLFALQAWSISVAESDYLDRNMAEYYQYVEGQNARYLKWMASERSRLTQPTSLDMDSLLNARYEQLRAEPLPFSSMTKLMEPTLHTSYLVPESFISRPVNPYQLEYLNAPVLQYHYPAAGQN